MCCGDYDTSGNPSRKSIVSNLVDYEQFSACRLICEIHCKNIFKDAEDNVIELKQTGSLSIIMLTAYYPSVHWCFCFTCASGRISHTPRAAALVSVL